MALADQAEQQLAAGTSEGQIGPKANESAVQLYNAGDSEDDY